MIVETDKKNGLFTIHLDAETRDDTDFLHRFNDTQDEMYCILHRGREGDTPTLTILGKR